jgi:DNA transformation protein
MATQNCPQELTSLPNIGREVARLLVAGGVRTPAELTRLGAICAAERIRAVRPGDPPCRSMLAGLEGAIRGVRWHAIPREEREALWKEYQGRVVAPRAAPRKRSGK